MGFHLIPISIAAWYIARWAGFVMLAMSAAAWIFDDIITSDSYLRPAVPYWDIAIKIVFCSFLIHIISRLKNSLRLEKALSRIDHLTQVPNRKYFFELANLELEKARRYKHALTVAYIDINNFKLINDTLGHKIGDKVLYVTAQTIKNDIRTSDIIARVGGDEFVVFFPETGYESSEIALNRIMKRFSKVIQDNKRPITISIGAITCISAACAFDAIMTISDNLMYSAKKSGQNMIKHELLERISIVQPPQPPNNLQPS